MMKGYITVFFTIVLSLCMSLILVSLNGIRDISTRARIEESASISINSLFGEYERELWGNYNLTFVDAGYSYKADSFVLPEEHLMIFMNKNFDESGVAVVGKDLLGLRCDRIESLGVRFASDDAGAAIRKQACEYMLYKYKVAYIEELYGMINDYEKSEMEYSEYREIYEASRESINDLDDSESYELKSIKDISNNAVLKEEDPSLLLTLRIVFNSLNELSKETIEEEFLISNREKNTGNIKSTTDEKYVNKLLFREYLMLHTDNYIERINDTGLSYEMEYLIAGRNSDLENLESVLNRILLIRESCNIIALTKDTKKMQEIDTAAKIIATLVGAPEASEAIKAVIVIVKSYLESIKDLKELTNGEKVPFIKDSSAENEGMTYEDYLRLFLYLSKTDELTYRFMNLVELNVRLITDNQYFRLDYCFDAYKFRAECVNKNGTTYSITRSKDLEK